MKTLYVIRHAEAVSKNKGLPDFERSLVSKGIKSARSVARRLAKRGIGADLLISSPANRALETAHIFAKQLGHPIQKVILKSLMYDDANKSALSAVVREQPIDSHCVLLFGHDPSFSDVCAHLIDGFSESLPKSAVVGITFDVGRWADLQPGQGQLVYYDYPMTKTEQSRVSKAIRRTLAASMASGCENAMMAFDPKTAGRVQRHTEKSCRAMAARFIENAGLGVLMPIYLKEAAASTDS